MANFELNRDEVLKIINAILLTILTVVIGVTVSVLNRIDDKLDQMSIIVAGHNAESEIWKAKIRDLEREVDEHKIEQQREMEKFRDWVEATFARKRVD